MKESKVLKGIVVSAAVIALSFPVIASADGGEKLEGKSEKVGFADLNVEKKAGAKQLYRRLQLASKRVCGVESLKVVGSISAVSAANRCYKETLNSAVAKIDKPSLTEIHEG